MTPVDTIFGVLPLWIILLLAGVFSLVVTALLTPVAGRIAVAIGAVDQPGARRVHARPIPRLGGLALFGALAIVSTAVYFMVPGVFEENANGFAIILIGAALTVALGLYDDTRDARASRKLVAQIVIACIVFFGGLRLESISWPFVESGRLELGLWGLPITVLWFIGLMNAVNLIDGLDGLCSGISGIASLVLVIIMIGFDSSFYIVLAAITAGLCIGFLIHNYHPATIFLGDTGSLLLGYLLACATLTTGTKSTTFLMLVIPLLCIAVPIIDTGLAIIRRTRSGRHPFSPDREHLHHRLLDLGLGQKRAVWILWFLTAYLGLTAYTLQRADSGALIIANALFLLIGFTTLLESIKFLSQQREQDKVAAAGHRQDTQEEPRESSLPSHSSAV